MLYVATVLTVYGIETYRKAQQLVRFQRVATVLTVYGIETMTNRPSFVPNTTVATVLTVYGIETPRDSWKDFYTTLCCNSTYRLRY